MIAASSSPKNNMKDHRIAIVGTCGSGKSTLAQKLCDILHCNHIELDVYGWKPGWKKKTDEEFLDSVGSAIQAPSWVTCGNWGQPRDLIWKNATHLVWLRLPFYLVFWRLFKRTIHNIITKKPIAGGNVETFRQQFFSKASIFLWAFQTHWSRKETYNALINSGAYPHLKVIILHSQKEMDAWIKKIKHSLSKSTD